MQNVLLLKLFFITLLICFVCMHPTTAHTWLEGMWQIVISFYHVDPRDGTRVIGLTADAFDV